MSVLSRKIQAKNPDAYCQALKLFGARVTSFSTAQSHDLNWSRGLSSRRCSKPPVQKAAREALTHPGESGPAGPAHGAEEILPCAFAALTVYKVRGPISVSESRQGGCGSDGGQDSRRAFWLRGSSSCHDVFLMPVFGKKVKVMKRSQEPTGRDICS